MRHLAASAVFCLSCSAASAVAPAELTTSATILTPPVPSAPTTSEAPSVDAMPAAIVFPKSDACVYSATKLASSMPLRLSKNGTVFADARGGLVEAHVEVGAPPSAVARVEADGLSLVGYVANDDLTLHPAVPFVLREFAIPSSNASLRVFSSSTGKIEVVLPTPAGLERLGDALTGERACDDVGLDAPHIVPEEAIQATGKRTDKRLVVGRPVTLSIEPGGVPVAQITAADDLASYVTVIETRGGSSRLLWHTDRTVVFGWVDNSDLRPKGNGYAFGTGSGRLASHRDYPPSEPRRCIADVPLIASAASGERAVVGSILGGTTIHVHASGPTFSTVNIIAHKIHVQPDITFEVQAQDIEYCERLPSNPPPPNSDE